MITYKMLWLYITLYHTILSNTISYCIEYTDKILCIAGIQACHFDRIQFGSKGYFLLSANNAQSARYDKKSMLSFYIDCVLCVSVYKTIRGSLCSHIP